MLFSKTRIAVVVLGAAAVLVALPSASFGGCWDWLWPWSSSSPATGPTTYAPPYTAQRVTLMPVYAGTQTSGLPDSQTCRYVPETRYRWTYSRMPITTYRPVSACDPCTGRTTTVYRPSTTMTLLPWLHREPYTTYRMDCTNTCAVSCPTACGSSCPTWTYGTVSGGSSCPSGCPPITTTPGSYSTSPTPDPGYGSPGTFKDQPAESTGTSDQGFRQDLRLRPTPDESTDPASIKKPKLINPENRTAGRSVQYAAYYRPVQPTPLAAVPSSPPLDVSGWRAARD